MVSAMALFGRKKLAEAATEQNEEAVPDPERDAEPESEPISVEQYREALLAAIEPQPPLGIGLLDAFGRRLCENIVADIDLPIFTSASADGYAVRAADIATATPSEPVTLPVLDTLDSPVYRGAPLLENTAIRVAPGAPIPEGADAVVPIEQTDGGELEVRVNVAVAEGQHLRLAGSDIADGTMLLEAGRRLDARAIGLLAEVGLDKVLVRQPPRVVVLTVGSDLVPPGFPLASRAHRYDATTTLIAAAAKADGAQVFPAGTFGNDQQDIGPGAQGPVDPGRPDRRRAGPGRCAGRGAEGTRRRHRPSSDDQSRGRQAFALVGDDRTPVIALPAGASSAFVGYQAFVRPALRKLQGEPDEQPQSRILPARVALHGHDEATELIPAIISGRGVEPAGVPGTELAYDVARADALIVLPPAPTSCRRIADVEVWVLTPPGT